MRFSHLLIILSLFLAFSACSTTDEVDDKHARIMVIHDAVMPMMPELRKLEKAILDSMAQDTTLDESWRSAALELKQSQDMMWDWMNQYKKPEDSGEESLAYLEAQERSISKVSTQMHAARDMARKILNR